MDGNIWLEQRSKASDMARVRSTAPPRTLPAHQYLFFEGDAADCFYEIRSGMIRTTKQSPDGRLLVLDFKSRGDLVGLTDQPHYSYSAKTITDANVQAIHQKCLSNELIQHLLSISCRELNAGQNHMMLLIIKDPKARLASFLVRMARRQNSQHHIDLPMSRRDIAGYLGLTPETICRALGYFRQAHIIAQPTSTELTVLDWCRLLNHSCEEV